MFISSEHLDEQTPPETQNETTDAEKMLNLDQMVAKFQGDEIPSIPEQPTLDEADPFEPMKKALEEEEKKALLEK
jgi:hypothetical protein